MPSTNLQHVDLSSNHLTCRSALKLADVLRRCYSLQYLLLEDNDIGPEGLTALNGAISSCPSLHCVDLSSNAYACDLLAVLAQSFLAIEPHALLAIEAKAPTLANAFDTPTTISCNPAGTMDSENAPIIDAYIVQARRETTEAGIMARAHAFRPNFLPVLVTTQPQTANFPREFYAPSIQTSEGRHSSCPKNTIAVLDFSRNFLNDSDLLSVTTTLRNCRQLTKMDFSHNLLSSGAGRAIALVLAQSPSLADREHLPHPHNLPSLLSLTMACLQLTLLGTFWDLEVYAALLPLS